MEKALSLPLCEDRLAVLDLDQQKIYRGMYYALKDENVRNMLVCMAEENGLLGRRFIDGYIKSYINIMEEPTKSFPDQNS
tara:strand:+ start:471 stop:710 length:240 start_codon:yes stop_codon:yes gene_type:complete